MEDLSKLTSQGSTHIDVHTNAALVRNAANGLAGGVAITGAGSSLTLVNVRENTARDGGGVALLSANNAVLTSVNVESNSVIQNGGGVYMDKSTGCTVDGVTIKSNTADVSGGGMYMVESDVKTAGTGIKVTKCSSRGVGGGISLDRSGLTGNVADLPSGGALLSPTSAMTFEISGCSAHTNGGGVHASNGQCDINYVRMDSNTATQSNGGCMFIAGTASSAVYDSIMVSCTAFSKGGAVFFENGFSPNSVALSRLAIAHNQGGSGGGLRLEGATATVEFCAMHNNSATSPTSDGGGAVAVAGSSSALFLRNSTLTANLALSGGKGGGVSCNGAALTVTSCVLEGNIAVGGKGGGFYIEASNGEAVVQDTVVARRLRCCNCVATHDGCRPSRALSYPAGKQCCLQLGQPSRPAAAAACSLWTTRTRSARTNCALQECSSAASPPRKAVQWPATRSA